MKNVRNESKMLSMLDTIRDVENFVLENYSSSLVLCKSKDIENKNKLYFLVQSQEVLSLMHIAKITVFIEERLDFEDVHVQSVEAWEKDKLTDSFVDTVQYVASNSKNIERFMDKNFPKFSFYHQHLKEHGLPFFECEKMERTANDLLEKTVIDTCRHEVESKGLMSEDHVASLLTSLLKLAVDRGFDSKEIIDKMKLENQVSSINK